MSRWTEEEDKMLKEMHRKGVSQNKISKELNRSISSVNDRLYRLKILSNKNKTKKIKWTEEDLKTAKDLFFKKDKMFSEIDTFLNKKRGSTRSKFISLNLYSPKKKLNFNYAYDIGDVINNELIVVSQTRDLSGHRAYELKSIIHPKAPYQIVDEFRLRKGQGCSYASGKRIYEGNSLYSIKHIRPYLVDTEQAKEISPHHRESVLFKCPECNRKKLMKSGDLIRYGITCPTCSKGTSYPELFFMSYLEAKNIEYEYQVKFDNLEGRIFDFSITIDNKDYLVECNGLAHYDKQANSGVWDYEYTKQSDRDKEKYCNDNNINLIWLDCRKSDFSFIKQTIKNNNVLPDINNKDIGNMLKIIEKNRRYPVAEIIELYTKKGLSTIQIGEKFKLSHATIGNILKRNNVKTRVNLKRVRCVNTGEEFESTVKASEWCGLKYGTTIGYVCNGGRNYAGKHPITGEKLTWEYVD